MSDNTSLKPASLRQHPDVMGRLGAQKNAKNDRENGEKCIKITNTDSPTYNEAVISNNLGEQ